MQEQSHKHRPSVIPRSDIPVSDIPENVGLEVRPFDAHRILSEMVPRSDVTVAWTHAHPGEDVALRSHPSRGLLIILDGSAELVGSIHRNVEQGDVVTVPSGHEYGFRSIGAQGLHALHVAFEDEKGSASPRSTPLQRLLARNQERADQLLKNPFFMLLSGGKLESEAKRNMMRECLRVFSDGFQNYLFVRQWTCRDPAYEGLFNEHLREEVGHNELLKVEGNPRAAKDPILRATSTWFCHQMLVQDNIGKVVLNLVLETAGYYFHTLAEPVFRGGEGAEYFKVHAEGDEKHKDVGVELLEGHSPEAYARLERLLDSGWDMLEAMNRRVVHIVERSTASS